MTDIYLLYEDCNKVLNQLGSASTFESKRKLVRRFNKNLEKMKECDELARRMREEIIFASYLLQVRILD